MSVLTLAGKPINWDVPPKPTTNVMWSQRDMYGRPVIGSLRTIAFLDHLFVLAMKKYNSPIIVIQPPNNRSVAASAGTHDYDACFDWYIPNVPWREQERFARANGMANWWRRPPAFGNHQHGFPLPPREGTSINDDFKVAGFKVGKYVDGGHSLYGREVASSQLGDYYGHRTGLAGHAPDSGSWFPPNISATIFDLDAYIKRQQAISRPVSKGPDQLATLASHGPLARLGGDAGAALSQRWEVGVREDASIDVRKGVSALYLVDSNIRGRLPRFGQIRRIGGKDIDLIAFRKAKGGASVKVLKRKTVKMHIDGHDCYGVRVKVTFPSGKSVKFWEVFANIGRGASDEVFRAHIKRIHKAFGSRAVYNFVEIDEADEARERKGLFAEFPTSDFRYVGKNQRVVTLVSRSAPVRVVETSVKMVSPGMAKVSPSRVSVKTVLAPK
jgi:hypothetical protein